MQYSNLKIYAFLKGNKLFSFSCEEITWFVGSLILNNQSYLNENIVNF